MLGFGMESGYDLGYPGEAVERYDSTEWREGGWAERTVEGWV